MEAVTIERLALEDYGRCAEIRRMDDALDARFRREIAEGNRTVYIARAGGEWVGEIAFVLDTGDPDYTIPGVRVYLSRLIVKPAYQNRGIGGALIDHMLGLLRERGFREASIGVDKDNEAALHLYRKEGFTNVVFDGEDEDGAYYKLVRTL